MTRQTLIYAICWLAGLIVTLHGWKWNSTSGLLSGGGLLLIGYLLHKNHRKMIVISVLLFVGASAYGTWMYVNNHSILPENDENYELSGMIISPVEVDGDRVRFIIRTNQDSEKIAVTIRLTSQDEQTKAYGWSRGNLASITGQLTLPPTARNFGQFDYRDYLYNQQIHRLLIVKGLDSAAITTNPNWSITRLTSHVDTIRRHMDQSISELYPIIQAGFMSGMLIGLRKSINEEVFSLFSQLGLTHVIAISGLHVAIVIGGWMGLLRMLRVTRETNITSAMILIPIYVIISGCSPSVVRAGIMALIALYAARRHWLKDGLNIVSITAVIMTMWNPYYIYDVSFQLSFAVTAGLIICTPVISRMIKIGPNWLRSTLAVTLVAQAVSFPLTIYYFNQFSILSGLANFLLVPVFSLIVLPLGYMSLIIYYVVPSIAVWIAKLAVWCNEGCFWLMEVLDSVPVGTMVWASPPFAWIVVYIAGLLIMIWCIGIFTEVDSTLFPRLVRLARRMMITSLLFGIFWLVWGYVVIGSNGLSTVSFIDVGQGDSSLIRTPNNRVILVDGGGTINFHKQGDDWKIRQDPYDVGKDLLVPLLKKRGIGRIDYLIVTHSDMDHIGGLQAVLEEIPVKRILFNGTYRANPYTEKLFATALMLNIPLYPIVEGRELVVDEHTRLNFLYPTDIRSRAINGSLPHVDDQNGNSVVFMMTMYNSKFLYTGDMELAAERDILANIVTKSGEKKKLAPIDVLKVAHHGSKTSTAESWLGVWKPEMAVISVGERNMYRHPSPEVIDRLNRHGISILRTDLNGEVQMRVREEGIIRRVYVVEGG